MSAPSSSKCKLLNRIRNEPILIVRFDNDEIYAAELLKSSGICGSLPSLFERFREEENFVDLWAWLTPDWYEEKEKGYLDWNEEQVKGYLDVLEEAQRLARYRASTLQTPSHEQKGVME